MLDADVPIILATDGGLEEGVCTAAAVMGVFTTPPLPDGVAGKDANEGDQDATAWTEGTFVYTSSRTSLGQ